MPGRIGVSFDGFVSTREVLALACEAVDAGARSLWMAEHLGYREAAVTSMGFLMKTEHAVVVPTAVSPYLFHPVPTAMTIATLAEMAPGRTAIAVATGNPMFLREAGYEMARPLRAVREFVECLRALWSTEPVHYEGEFFRLAGARMAFGVPVPVPIYIGAIGEQMLRLAGRLADGVVLSAGLSVAYASRSLAVSAEGLVSAGRPPRDFRRAAYIYCAVAEDGRAALDAARGKIAFLFRNRTLADNIRITGIPVDQEAIMAAVAQRDLEAASRLVPDDAVEAFAIAGTPRHCRDRLEAYLRAGVDEPVLAVVGSGRERAAALALIRETSGW